MTVACLMTDAVPQLIFDADILSFIIPCLRGRQTPLRVV